MDKIIGIVQFAISNYEAVLASLALVVGALVSLGIALAGLFAMIPGDQPEKGLLKFAEKLKSIGEWLAKFSKKPKKE